MLGILGRRELVKKLDVPRIEAALKEAEQRTSGEIRVSVAPLFWGSMQREAERAFDRLGMTGTQERNGVLIFMCPSRRRFVVLGDEGIHQKVGQSFWDRVAQALSAKFKEGDFTGGLIDGIHAIGHELCVHFPHRGEADSNELPDEVDFGGKPRSPGAPTAS
jgi:uncharacterized membrane protein